MQHYFIEKSHTEKDYFSFNVNFCNQTFTFRSCDSIFSKDELDLGSATLIDTVLKQLNLNGLGLDFGCGYGAVGIILSKIKNLKMDYADINGTAIELTQFNAKQNGVVTNKVIKTDNFANISSNYDFIVTNPPIKTGKKLLFSIMDNCFNHLNKGGSLTVVIRKSHGEESLKKYLTNLFNNCEILKRNKGFYILHSIKN